MNLARVRLKNINPTVFGSIFLVLGCCLFGGLVLAADRNHEKEQVSPPFQIGVSMGYGYVQTPFRFEGNEEFYMLLDINYYGNHFFFDNGDLGAYLYTGDSTAINVIATVKNDRDIFDPVNHISRGLRISQTISSTNFGGISDPAIDGGGLFATVPKRENSTEAGLELLVENDSGNWQVQWLTDVSNTHGGQELWAAFSNEFKLSRSLLSYSLGFNLKDAEYIDYYYGITAAEEADAYLTQYQGESNTNLFIKLGFRYSLTPKVGLIGIANYEKLGSGIRQSPLVSTTYLSTLFFGIYYQLF